MQKYTVVLDEKRSYLIPATEGATFDKACDAVIDYSLEDNIAAAYHWLSVKLAGETAYNA